jgi:uncharacterized protein with HEPN domain
MSTLEPRVLKLLGDMSYSAEQIIEWLAGQTLANFTEETNRKDRSAVSSEFMIIGEAASVLLRKYPEFCKQHQEIQVNAAREMRNFLVHVYDGVDWETVWNTAHDDLPRLVAAIYPLLPKNSVIPLPTQDMLKK